MQRSDTEGEKLFREMSRLAASAGFQLGSVRMIGSPCPTAPGIYAEYHLSDRNYTDRLMDVDLLRRVCGG